MANPTKYTPELAEKICEHVGDGLSLAKIAALPGMPSAPTVRAWRRAHPEFDKAYFEANKYRDDELIGKLNDLNQRAVEVAETEEDPRRASVIVNALHNQAQDVKWLISKLAPRYGDKVQAEISGELAIKRVVSDL